MKPFAEYEVSIELHADALQLSGTLTLPVTDSPCPAVLLLPGSGKNDRDETVCGHKPFRVWAEVFAKAGIAVLRLDDRGTGGSGGDKDQCTHPDLLRDVRQALEFLRGRPEVDACRVGLLGHSEGGLLASMAAAEDPAVAFLVLLAAPGIPGDALVLAQAEALSRAAGASEALVAHERGMTEQAFKLITDAGSSVALRQDLITLLCDRLVTWPDAPVPEAEADTAAQGMAEVLLSPAFVTLLRSRPADHLCRVRCPVLALNGGKDLQVDAHANLSAIRAALGRSPSTDTTVSEVPGVNHLFQPCETGAIEEYEMITTTIDGAVLHEVVDWMRRRVVG
jgi:pimeloyl-ACP methyl ester carboxylesterase